MSIRTTVPVLGRDTTQKHHILRQVYGHAGLLDVEPVRAHLQSLVDIGVSEHAIARAAGISHGFVPRILSGATQRITPRHARRLLAVDHRPHPRQVWVLNIGVRRRIEALRAYGWPIHALADQLGTDHRDITTRLKRDRCTYLWWSDVDALYERLSTTHGGSRRAATYAERQGWLLPMEWEGHDIDDPRVTPPRSRRTAGVAMRDRIAERRQEVQRLVDLGVTTAIIAARLGVTPRQIDRDRAALRRQAAA